MKRQLFYYWDSFCKINASVSILAALILLFFPEMTTKMGLSTICTFFTLPLLISPTMSLKYRYRFCISIIFFLCLEFLWNFLHLSPLQPSWWQFLLTGLLLGLGAVRNYFLKK